MTIMKTNILMYGIFDSVHLIWNINLFFVVDHVQSHDNNLTQTYYAMRAKMFTTRKHTQKGY